MRLRIQIAIFLDFFFYRSHDNIIRNAKKFGISYKYYFASLFNLLPIIESDCPIT